ncbi:MAG: hypothetical protein ACSHX5_05810 [Phycisphaerales bacterium]
MEERSQKDLELLIKRRWDPRVGMGKHQGVVEWFLGITLTSALFVGCCPIGMMPMWAHALVWGFFGVSLVSLMMSWFFTRGVSRVKIQRRVQKHDGFLCVWCNYPFTGLGDQGHCPECGSGFTKELCQRLYGQAYRKYTPSPQEFGKRESLAWREAIQYRDNPELIEPSPPPVVERVEDRIESEISLSDEQIQEVNRLVLRRIDPRKGVGPVLGMTKYLCLVLAISMFVIVTYGIIPASRSLGADAFKWMLVYVLFFVGFMICWLIPIGIRKRTHAKTRKHEYILCPWCRHGLSHLGDSGQCPGCGSGFRRLNCELLYMNAYRGFKPSKEEFKEREEQAWREAVWLRDQES